MSLIDRVIFHADGSLDVFGPTARRHQDANTPWINRELQRLAKLGVDLERAEVVMPWGQKATVKLDTQGAMVEVEVEK